MIARWPVWWRQRTVREQRLLLAMTALLVVTFVWFVVIRPLGDLLAAARAEAARAAIVAAETGAQADAIRMLERSRPPTLRTPVAGLLTQATAEAGFTGARIAPGPEGVSVGIDSARAPAFFGWIEMLEMRRGLVVERLSTQPRGNGTLSATIVFRERGR